ncbi:MAG: 4'-phosphopantetheinyl transferase family protein [Beijerinckiaceae bacterium]
MTGTLAPPHPLLRIDDAVAFLVADNSDDAAQRDACATAVLSHHAGQTVTVARRASGRPCLMAPWPELGVSLSHRDHSLVIGFHPHGTAGVDCEADDPSLNVLVLARDHFTPAEAHALAHLPDEQQRPMFLRLWTAKEAVLKATGRGIADGLCWPDFSLQMASLAHDGAVLTVAARAPWPDMRVAVAATMHEGRRITAALAASVSI